MIDKATFMRFAKRHIVPAENVADFVLTYIDLEKLPIEMQLMGEDKLKVTLINQCLKALLNDGYAMVEAEHTTTGTICAYLPHDPQIMTESKDIVNKFLVEMGCKLPQERIKQNG